MISFSMYFTYKGQTYNGQKSDLTNLSSVELYLEV